MGYAHRGAKNIRESRGGFGRNKRERRTADVTDISLDLEMVVDEDGTEIVSPNEYRKQLEQGKMSKEDIEKAVDKHADIYTKGELIKNSKDLRNLLEKGDMSKEEIEDIIKGYETDVDQARQVLVDRQIEKHRAEEKEQILQDEKRSKELKEQAEHVAEQGVLSDSQERRAIEILASNVFEKDFSKLGVENLGIKYKEYQEIISNYADVEAEIKDAEDTIKSLSGTGISSLFKRMPLFGNRGHRIARKELKALKAKMRRYNYVLETVNDAKKNMQDLEQNKDNEWKSAGEVDRTEAFAEASGDIPSGGIGKKNRERSAQRQRRSAGVRGIDR